MKRSRVFLLFYKFVLGRGNSTDLMSWVQRIQVLEARCTALEMQNTELQVVYINTYMHTYIHTHTHSYIYIYVCTCVIMVANH